MPPPNRIPSGGGNGGAARPASQMSSGNGDPSSRAPSPRKTSVSKRNGVVPASGKSASEGETNIQVVVRCRGRSPQELAQTSPVITTSEGALSRAITVETTPTASSTLSSFTTASSYGGGGPTTKTYPFDKVFGPEADQTMVFREVAEGMLDEVLAGYNCTIFAYGQTGTGKTYTMQGELDLSPLLAPQSSAGIVPRVLHRLFSLLESQANTEYTVRCSYVELYNEELRDLLAADYSGGAAADKQPMSMGNGSGPAPGGLKLYEDGKKGVMIQGLEEVAVKSLKDALGVVGKGVQRRQVAETKMNTESSRSHTIFSITVHVKENTLANGGDDLLRIGKFNLVDLAGSEAIGRSGATDKRAREAGMINQSLLTLGRVISALTEKSSHIPYRESKLTRLLQDSLGGRTKTCIVATVSPTRSNMEETLSTLDYAIRAKSIRNRPEINAHLTKSGVLKEYLGDIERLKAEVMAAREKNGIYVPEESWREMHEAQARMKSEYDEAKLRANAATVELETKRKEFDLLSDRFILTSHERDEAREAERQLGILIAETKEELEVVRVKLEEEAAVSRAYEDGEKRLAGVAKDLQAVAKESVQDVGGLFDKIDRKAKVLGGNAKTAQTFAHDMSALSAEVRSGLDKLSSVQGRFGDELQAGLEAYTKHAQKHSKKDLDRLESSFQAFGELVQTLDASIEMGKADAAETGRQLEEVKGQVQGAVRRCTDEMRERSGGLVREVVGRHAEQMLSISSILESTADLVDAVISTATQHLLVERQAAESSRAAADRAAKAEIARLQVQNALLAQLWTDEQTKTATLRTELLSNLTNLIVSFTDSRSSSLSSALSTVQSANDESIHHMQTYAEQAELLYAETDKPRRRAEEELAMGKQTGAKQRAAGGHMVGEVKRGLRDEMERYGVQVEGEMQGLREGVDGVCERFGEVAGDAASRAAERASQQSAHVAQLSQASAASYESGKAKLGKDMDSVTNLSESLLKTHASTSKSYTKHSSATLSKLASLSSTTSTFLESGIVEDVPTGETPRKKQWHMPARWERERVQPRDVLLQAFRERKAQGLPEPEYAYAYTGESSAGWSNSELGREGQGEGEVRSLAAGVPLPRSRSVSPVEGDTAGQAKADSISAGPSTESISTMAFATNQPAPTAAPAAPASSGIPPTLGHSRIPSSSGIPTLSSSQIGTGMGMARAKRGGERVVSANMNGTSKMAPLGEHGGGMNVQVGLAGPGQGQNRRGEKRVQR